MGVPRSSTRISGPAGTSQPADQRDPFPIYTLLRNAGLSEADTLEMGDLLMRRIRARLALKAATDTPEQRLRYRNDPQARIPINQMIVAEEIARLDFSQHELKVIDKSLDLGLVAPPEKGPLIAKTTLPDGTRENFEILERPTPGDPRQTIIKSRKDGRVHRH
jgi:hypothetical protein